MAKGELRFTRDGQGCVRYIKRSRKGFNKNLEEYKNKNKKIKFENGKKTNYKI